MTRKTLELLKQAGIIIVPRRPCDDDQPNGYLESDNDFMDNNREAIIKLIDGDGIDKLIECYYQSLRAGDI